MHVDLLLHADWVLPVDAHDRTLAQHSVAVTNGRITALLPRYDATAQLTATTVVDLPGHVLLPGLINAHTHAAMTLLRGLADDLPLMTWLHDHIWPAEQRWVAPAFVADGTRLAVIEMLRGGVTCFNDMYFFPETTAQVAAEAGMRVVAGMIVVDFPTGYAADAAAYLERGQALHDHYRGHALVKTAWAPHAPYTVADAPLAQVGKLAEQMNVPIHIHLHETQTEIAQSLHQYGHRPLARLDQLGLLTPRLVAIHMTHLTADEITRLATAGCHVVHCPESNLKLASGFCPVVALQQAGVNVALGTDGAASNNDLDVLGELRTAALLAKGVSGQAAALPAAQAVRMATLAGAQALGLADEIGSLTVGKAADMVALDLRAPHTQPLYHPASQVVYAANRQQVRQVWIHGQQVVRDGQVVTLDAAAIVSAAQQWQVQIAAADEG